MARLRGRAKVVLDEAEERMNKARLKADDLQFQASVASAEWRAYAASFYALQQSLTTPRQPATTGKKGGSGKRGSKRTSAKAEPQLQPCAFVADGQVCNDPPSSPIHDPLGGYAGYHPFVPPAQPAARPSSPSNGVGGSTANIETGKAGALDAARASVGGE